MRLSLVLLAAGLLAAGTLDAQAANPARLTGNTFGLRLEAKDGIPPDLAGTYEIFFASSEYQLLRDNVAMASGTYRVAADTLFLDEKQRTTGTATCPTGATYTWRIATDSLRLKVVKDECLPRLAIVQLRPLYRKK